MSSPLRLPDPRPREPGREPGQPSRRTLPPLRLAPRRRPRPPKVPFVVVVALVALGGVVGLLLFNTSMQQASFAASALERHADTLAAREQKLQMELEGLRDPQRVARAARDAGMVVGRSTCFLSLADGSTSGPCQPATAEDGMRIEAQPQARPGVLDPAPRYVDPPAEQNQVGDTGPRDGRGDARGARNGARDTDRAADRAGDRRGDRDRRTQGGATR
ncbi:hypothetical protein [Nocardioides sp. CFH 31398]|uniref:hypothetical protein n=1 Tax=Nocardioides sp. CFH 31398 TaxID=2919579 RepID=UPI001F06A476|nr:hypothetical protein [Nocardioides sp. CFH 31398]MCH1868272.1 hypothetical protein [Nocardioides sp. CFH 31398]